ncbi:MAG: DNA-directed RNA polymerase subunit omega [Nitrospirae bacterium]|jgi:DNA-directed RNA polymerase subunit omega|nr:DNA-directed RNA polymerase subunit omega [Nitrospirota bacterium]
MNDLVTRPIEVTPDIIDSRYRLVITAAKRARQLMEGSPVKVDKRYLKETTTALQEILEKKIPILTGEDAIRVEANRREKLRERVRSEERFSYSRGYALETSDAIHAEVMTYHHPEEGSAQPVDGEHDTEDTDVED